jgi:exoribonuclease R
MAGQSQRHDTEKRLLELLSKRGIEGVRKADLRRQLGLHGQAHARHFSDILRRLVASGTVLRRQRGRYALPQEANMIAGRLSVHHRGFGFVTTEDGQPDVFIPPSGIGLALSGDLVEIVLEEDTGRGPAGRVARILERGTEEVTGEFVTQDDVFFVRPLRRDFPEFIPLNSDIGETDHLQATHGDWVTARLLHPERQGQHLHATLLRRLNTGATLTDDLDAIVSEFDLPPPYSSADCKLAETLAPVDITRVDRTDLTIITVDPVDAKDFDDAVSLEPGTEPGTVILGVHIADVAAYVQPNSPLDAAARERSFTAYLPGRTLPMLPRPLAAEICSLREGVERPAHSVFMEINSESGAPIRSWRLRTLVRVTKRLSFDGVQAFADGRHLDALPPAVEAMLGQLLPLAARMRQRRAAEEQFLDLATTEVRVICEENPPLIRGLKRSEPNEAHELVEEFMLAANVAVAQELREHRIPGIFRVHPKPQEPDIKEFRTWVKAALNLQPGHLPSCGLCPGLVTATRLRVITGLARNAIAISPARSAAIPTCWCISSCSKLTARVHCVQWRIARPLPKHVQKSRQTMMRLLSRHSTGSSSAMFSRCSRPEKNSVTTELWPACCRKRCLFISPSLAFSGHSLKNFWARRHFTSQHNAMNCAANEPAKRTVAAKLCMSKLKRPMSSKEPCSCGRSACGQKPDTALPVHPALPMPASERDRGTRLQTAFTV